MTMMTRFRVVAIAAGLLLAISGPTFAAQQTRHPSSTHSRGAVKEGRGVVTSRCDWSHVPAFDYRRGTSAYPFGPGCNFPYPDRPYGDPGRW
jgi:hypothetical protein